MDYRQALKFNLGPTCIPIPDDVPPQYRKEAHFYQEFNKGVFLVSGKQKVGKTGVVVSIAWWLKRLFHRGITADQMLDKRFGRFIYYTRAMLKHDLEAIKELADDPNLTEDENGLWNAAPDRLPYLYNKVQIMDEVYKKLDRRRNQDPELLVYGDMFLQYGHLNTAFFLISHGKKLVDKYRASDWLTHEIHCEYNVSKPYTTTCQIYNLITGKTKYLDVYIPRYAPMYRAFAPIAPRTNIKL